MGLSTTMVEGRGALNSQRPGTVRREKKKTGFCLIRFHSEGGRKGALERPVEKLLLFSDKEEISKIDAKGSTGPISR